MVNLASSTLAGALVPDRASLQSCKGKTVKPVDRFAQSSRSPALRRHIGCQVVKTRRSVGNLSHVVTTPLLHPRWSGVLYKKSGTRVQKVQEMSGRFGTKLFLRRCEGLFVMWKQSVAMRVLENVALGSFKCTIRTPP